MTPLTSDLGNVALQHVTGENDERDAQPDLISISTSDECRRISCLDADDLQISYNYGHGNSRFYRSPAASLYSRQKKVAVHTRRHGTMKCTKTRHAQKTPRFLRHRFISERAKSTNVSRQTKKGIGVAPHRARHKCNQITFKLCSCSRTRRSLQTPKRAQLV